jgi:hypothetical protein
MGWAENGVRWTPERIEIVVARWAEGIAGGPIAAELGVSRSAIQGLIGRLRQAGRRLEPRPTRQASQRGGRKPRSGPSVRIGRRVRECAITRQIPDPERPISRRKNLLDLEPNECRFPTNDPPTRHGPHEYCGHKAFKIGTWGPYCTYHWRELFRERKQAKKAHGRFILPDRKRQRRAYVEGAAPQ